MALHRRHLLGVLAVGIGSAVSGCLDTLGEGDATTDDPDHRTTVAIRDGEFAPRSLDAAAGHEVTVVFENHDERAHVLRGDFAAFEVRVPPGETVSRVVTVPSEPGDYAIDCSASSGQFELTAVPEDVLGGCRLDETDE